jgi:hypothetical protein
VVVGPGGAADCFNEFLYQSFSVAQTEYVELPAQMGSTTARYTTMGSRINFDGRAWDSVTHTLTRGEQTWAPFWLTQALRVEASYDVVHAGVSVQAINEGRLMVGPPMEIFYADPLPRDRSFSLDAGGKWTTEYKVRAVTNQPAGTTTPSSWSVTAHYLGQEKIVVRGVEYQTCKFRHTDTRDPEGYMDNWYAKTPATVWGLLVRSEGRTGTTPVSRELVSGSIRSFFAP